jgi:hypothetical protein
LTDAEEPEIMSKILNPFFKGGLAQPYDVILRSKHLYKLLPIPLAIIPVVIYFQKNSPLTKLFSDKIQDMMAAGLVEYWIKLEGYSTSEKEEIISEEPKVMTVNQLQAAFIFCLCGNAIGLLIFVGELFFQKIEIKYKALRVHDEIPKLPYIE